AGVENIVHDDDVTVVEIRKAGFPDDRTGTDGLQVVAIQSDVELSNGDLGAFGLLDQPANPGRQLDAPALDTDEYQLPCAATPLNDFGRHARQGTADRAVVEQLQTGEHRGRKVADGTEGGKAASRTPTDRDDRQEQTRSAAHGWQTETKPGERLNPSLTKGV